MQGLQRVTVMVRDVPASAGQNPYTEPPLERSFRSANIVAFVWTASTLLLLPVPTGAETYMPPNAGCVPSTPSSGYNWVCATPPAEGTLPNGTSALVRSDPRCNGGPSVHSAGDNRPNPATGERAQGNTGRTIRCQVSAPR